MITNHRLDIAKKMPSENYNQRPDKTEITLVVIHNISLPPGEFGNTYIEDFFTNKLQTNKHNYFKTLEGVKVSAHLLIKRDGGIVQFVDLISAPGMQVNRVITRLRTATIIQLASN